MLPANACCIRHLPRTRARARRHGPGSRIAVLTEGMAVRPVLRPKASRTEKCENGENGGEIQELGKIGENLVKFVKMVKHYPTWVRLIKFQKFFSHLKVIQ